MLGCVCVRVPAPLVARLSWLGCVVRVCVLGLGLRLRPAFPGWGVGVCVCSCARSACTAPLLAGVCGVGVCAWAWVSAAPPHSWVGCWGVCVLVCALRLYPGTPRWGVWGGCVCLGLGFGCAPPLLDGVLGYVCCRVPAPLVPRHSWLGCVVWVCLSWLGFRLRPATPGWVVGVCLCSYAPSACTPPLLAGVCGVGVCDWAWVSPARRHSWLGRWVVCVLVCALRLFPGTPGWGVWCGCVCLGSGFGCAPPLLAGVLGCVCVCLPAPLVPRLSWLGCVVRVCVLWLGFRLRPPTPGSGVGVCVCLCARSARTPALLAGVCGVDVCAWAWVSAAPRLSPVGCWGMCVFVCPLRLYPATPGWGVWCGCVCFGSGFGCAPPLLAGCWGVCVFLCALRLYPATPGWGVRRACVCLGSGLGCAPPLLAGLLGCVCVCVCPLWLYPSTPGWGGRCGCVCLGSGFGCAPPLLAGVFECVCLCAPSVCTPQLLARVCGVVVCAWARVSAAPRLSWLGSLGVCVPLCARSACTPPLLPGLCGVGACVWAPVSTAPRRSWLGCSSCVCVCVCARSGCTPPLLAGVRGVGVCAWARVSAAPRHSWLGRWGVCVLVCALRLYPATPGWGVWCGCVCLGSGFGCAPPLLAGVLGCVCVCLRAPLVPRHSLLGCAACVCGLGVAWHLFLCCGSLRVVRAARVCGTRWPLSLGTCSCAVVLAGGVPLWRALWPRIGVPPLVRSGRSRCSSRLSRRCGAFPHPGGLRPRIYWAAARETWRPVENRALCACRWPLPKQGLRARSTSYPIGAPRWGCPWRVPPASVLGCVRCGGWRVWTRSLTRLVSRTARLSTGDSACAPGLFRVDADTSPCGSEDATPGSRACVRARALLGQVGLAGPPGAFWCASPFPVAALSFFFVWPSPGLGRPVCCVFFFLFPFVRPRCLRRSVFSGPGCLGPWRLVRSPPFFLSGFFFFVFPPPPPCFFLLGVLCPAFLFVFFLFFSFFFSSALFVVLFCFFVFLPVVRCGFGLCVCGCGLCWCVVLLALRSVVRCVFCLVLCGVLVLGSVFVPCCPARCCAWSCWAVFVVFYCRVLLCSLLVFFRGGPSCFGLCGARPWCVLLFGVALSRCFLVLASVALCRLVLCRAVVRHLVPCCVVCFVAVLGSRPASSAAVACCCALSVLGRGAVSSCRAACGPCAVVPCAVFLGASLFAAPLVWCCVGVPVSLLPVRCSLASLFLHCVSPRNPWGTGRPRLW